MAFKWLKKKKKDEETEEKIVDGILDEIKEGDNSETGTDDDYIPEEPEPRSKEKDLSDIPGDLEEDAMDDEKEKKSFLSRFKKKKKDEETEEKIVDGILDGIKEGDNGEIGTDDYISEEPEPGSKEKDFSDTPGEVEEGATDDQEEKKSFLGRLKKGLSKTRAVLTTNISGLFAGKTKIDDDFLDDLEELLITSDIGVKVSTDLMQIVSKKASKISDPEQLKEILKKELFLHLSNKKLEKTVGKPHVIMVIGVNGTGKTTTIGKLASRATAAGKKVLVVAADTFRAAAIDQLMIWADRAGADIVKHKENSDPAAVAYDGIDAGIARDADIVLIDTAGRLHTKVNLMEELKKIKRALAKKIPEAPHDILLVLDATTGQNALSQAKTFNDALNVTGIALTKLDGTAKGGVVVSICSTLDIPIKYVGVGENIEDLQPFDSEQFVAALFDD